MFLRLNRHFVAITHGEPFDLYFTYSVLLCKCVSKELTQAKSYVNFVLTILFPFA